MDHDVVSRLEEGGLLWRAEGHPRSIHQPRREGVPPFGITAIDTALPGGGFAPGTIHDWLVAPDATHLPCLLPATIAANTLRHDDAHGRGARVIVWIGAAVRPAPWLLHRLFVRAGEATDALIRRCLFVDPGRGKNHLWAIEAALRSPAVAAVVSDVRTLSLIASRRLALAARQSGAIGLIISHPTARAQRGREHGSAAATAWRCTPVPSEDLEPWWRLELLRCKGTPPRHTTWIVAHRDEEQTDPLHIPAVVGDRSRVSAPAAERRYG